MSTWGSWREAEKGVDYSIVLTFGGRPRFLCPAGADEPSAAAEDDVAVLFLLPLGRPRPRLAGVAGEGPERVKIASVNIKKR